MRFPPEIMPNHAVYTGNYTGNYYEEFTASIYNIVDKTTIKVYNI